MNDSMSIYKPDWEESQQRMTEWWAGKKVDRAIVSIKAPKTKKIQTIYNGRVPDKYIDFDTVFNNLDHYLQNTFFGGEAFPRHYVYFGPMFINTVLFGTEPVFETETTWYEPCYDNIDELLECEFDIENNKWWQLIQEMTKRSVDRSGGSYLTIDSSVCSFIDSIAALIGNEKALIAMALEPEKVKVARDRLAAYGKLTYNKIHSLTRKYGFGSIDGMNVWCPETIRTAQCDLSVMISPDMFNDLVMDDLKSTYEYVENGIYHLDGEGEIQHLDSLFTIDKIKIIQWMPSPKISQDPVDWIPLFRRIQESGRIVFIESLEKYHTSVVEVLNKIDRNKVFFNINCPDEETARQLLRDVEKVGK